MDADDSKSLYRTRYYPFILLVIILLLPLFIPSRYILRTLVNIFFFAALGCAWNIIGGYAGQLSLAHAGFMAIGAYPTALLLLNLNVPPWIGSGIYARGFSMWHVRARDFCEFRG